MSNINYHDSLFGSPTSRLVALNNCQRESWREGQPAYYRETPQSTFRSGHPQFFLLRWCRNMTATIIWFPYDCPRFGTGEDVPWSSVDPRNRPVHYCEHPSIQWAFKMHGSISQMSPDDHFLDLKRVIMACGGSPRRITVIMPYLCMRDVRECPYGKMSLWTVHRHFRSWLKWVLRLDHYFWCTRQPCSECDSDPRLLIISIPPISSSVRSLIVIRYAGRR